MIPTQTKTADIQSNLTGKTGKFQIDAAAMAHVMSVLSKLYSDEPLACIREYSTNARDSHKEAGQTRPIEISLPSGFRRTFIVRDFGIGMDAETLEDTYSHYGKSTKTSSNAFNGMLGMGSKSALAYTNTFTVVGRKNGVETKAVITKDDNSVPEFMIIDVRDTDEPNGVEVQIPVREAGSFIDKAHSFFKWWEPGTVLVNGQQPQSHDFDFVKDIAIPGFSEPAKVYATLRNNTGYYSNDTITVVMGDVPYPVDMSRVRTNDLGIDVAIYMPIGAVQFTPSRESLVYEDSDILTYAQDAMAAALEYLRKDAVDKIVNAPTAKEAMKEWESASRIVRADYSFWSSMEYKGEPFRSNATFGGAIYAMERNYYGSLNIHEYHGTLGATYAVQVGLIVTGADPDKKPNTTIKRRALQYAKNQGIDADGRYSKVFFVEKDTTSMWFGDIPRVDWDTVSKVKLPRPPKDPNAPKKTTTVAGYDVWIKDKDGKVTKESNTTKMPSSKIVYYHNVDIKKTRGGGVGIGDMLSLLPAGTSVVELGKARLPKFLKKYPKAEHWETPARAHVKSLIDNLTDVDFESHTVSYNVRTLFTQLDDREIAKIKDDELRKLAESVRKSFSTNGVSQYDRVDSTARILYNLTGDYDVYSGMRKNAKASILGRYPLISGNHPEHSLLYVNAVYDSLN